MLLKGHQVVNHNIVTLVYKYFFFNKMCSNFSIFPINFTIKYLKTRITMNIIDIANSIIYKFSN